MSDLKLVTCCALVHAVLLVSMDGSNVFSSVVISRMFEIFGSLYAFAKAEGQRWERTFTWDPEESQGVRGCQQFGTDVDGGSIELPKMFGLSR